MHDESQCRGISIRVNLRRALITGAISRCAGACASRVHRADCKTGGGKRERDIGIAVATPLAGKRAGT